MHRATLPSPKLSRPVAVLAGALLALACGSAGPFEHDNGDSSEPPPLPDAIPYDALESGKIVFGRTFPDGSGAIYVVDVDNRRTWAFDPYDRQPVRGAYGTFSVWGGPSVSPDGTRITFHGGLWGFVVDVDGFGMQRVGLVGDRICGVPAWSADGSQLYFWAARSDCYGYDRVLYAQPAARPADRRIVAEITGSVGVLMSVGPTGAVLFTGSLPDSEGDSVYGIYLLEEGAGPPRPLIVVPVEPEPGTRIELTSPVWSPDGTRIAYMAGTRLTAGDLTTGSLAVMVADADGTGRTEFLRREISWRQPGMYSGLVQAIFWSPDGSRLLFNVPEDDYVSHLYVMNADGSGLRAVTTTPGVADQSPSWSR